jgi:hypothetical protein
VCIQLLPSFSIFNVFAGGSALGLECKSISFSTGIRPIFERLAGGGKVFSRFGEYLKEEIDIRI